MAITFDESAEQDSKPGQSTDGAEEEPSDCQTFTLEYLGISIDCLNCGDAVVDGDDAKDESKTKDGKHAKSE